MLGMSLLPRGLPTRFALHGFSPMGFSRRVIRLARGLLDKSQFPRSSLGTGSLCMVFTDLLGIFRSVRSTSTQFFRLGFIPTRSQPPGSVCIKKMDHLAFTINFLLLKNCIKTRHFRCNPKESINCTLNYNGTITGIYVLFGVIYGQDYMLVPIIYLKYQNNSPDYNSLYTGFVDQK